MKLVALTGVARAGKDSFCKALIEIFAEQNIVAKRYSLADELKQDINPFFIEKFGINIFSCAPEEKELVRPMLVEYGRFWRIKSNGTYWTNKLQKQIEKDLEITNIIPIVTDIRYDIYPNDELQWVKNNSGVLIHIDRYNVGTINASEFDTHSPIPLSYRPETLYKKYIEAPNKDEKENDPKLKAGADFCFEWQTNSNQDVLKSQVKNFIENNKEFNKWLLQNK